MELSWSTFLLEIINFLVLIWILKHFLYKPVLAIIAKRQAGVEKTLGDARALHADADKLKQQYEARLEHWNQERQQARDTLSGELEAERSRKLSALRDSLQQEREKARVAEARRLADAQRKLEEHAFALGARFAGKLLTQATGAETEQRLVELAIGELGQLSPERIAALQAHNGVSANTITVTSAYPLPEQQRQQLRQALGHNGWTGTPRFQEDPSLLAGLRITIGAWVLAANLRDELRGFAELAQHEQ
ncbi:F0F1 ATP synthase subunit delta [Porticoccus sp.]